MNAMPKVKVYPLCSECRTPYVLRHALIVFTKKMKSEGAQWIWQRDCKHKKAAPISSESPLDPATEDARRAYGDDLARGSREDARSAK